ncbi:sensor histidine kinase [Solirubrobacter soli]|uniref:sensor histidine kinase n=1 Tax=Solirubrobacter soli TaxID=363832 RepID=UPI0003FF57A6|nr:histidine kinase [Solirubrobacter soli]
MAAAAAALAASALILAVIVSTGTDQPRSALVHILVVVVPIAVGLNAMQRPQSARFGRLLIAAGLVWSVSLLSMSSSSTAYSVGRVAAWLIHPVLLYVMLAFPEGHIAKHSDRVLFVVALTLIASMYLISALFVEAYPVDTPWASCDADCPANAFLVLDHEPAVMQDVVQPLRELFAVAVMAAVALSLLRRVRGASHAWGHQVVPVMIACVGSCITLIAFLIVRRFWPDSPAVEAIGTAWALWIPGIAVAFFIGQMRRRLEVATILERLSIALRTTPDVGGLRDALAEAVHDPDVEVLLPTDEPGTWRDTRGRSTSVAEAIATGKQVTAIGDDSGPTAMLVHDLELGEDEELLEAVCSLSLSALRHQRLRSWLVMSLGELEESRKRIVRAADLERSRIERNLHDGAQQRLIMLRIKLSLAVELLETDPEAGRAAVADLGEHIDVAMEELRAIAHGVYPAMLTDRGLVDALTSVAVEASKPVHLRTFGVTRQAAEIETAVYFTCMEALQNSIKHAGSASGVWLTLRQGKELRFEVRDDGPGFIPLESDANGGLRNMRDRVEAIGGRLEIDTSPGHGTRVIGRIPLR